MPKTTPCATRVMRGHCRIRPPCAPSQGYPPRSGDHSAQDRRGKVRLGTRIARRDPRMAPFRSSPPARPGGCLLGARGGYPSTPVNPFNPGEVPPRSAPRSPSGGRMSEQPDQPTRAPTRARLCRRPYLAAPVRDRNSISIACSMSACVLVSSCAAMTRSCVKIDATNTTPSGLLGAGASWAMSFTFDAIKKAIEDA